MNLVWLHVQASISETQCLKSVFLKIQDVAIRTVFANPVMNRSMHIKAVAMYYTSHNPLQ